MLHTSGSTGHPKPVDVTHGLIATIDAQQLLPDIGGRPVSAKKWADRRVFIALPPFHSAGINFFSYSVFQGTAIVLGPAGQPPSLGTVDHMLNFDEIDAGVMPPSLLSEVAMDDSMLSRLRKWSSVAFGGGPLPQDSGDALSERTTVLQILGSTETHNVPELVPESRADWAYHEFHPDVGIEFQHREADFHELTFVRDPHKRRHQGAFWTFSQLDHYGMKDLYEPHPTKSGLWHYRTRLDDLIVLSNGEKFNPRDAETLINQNPHVKSALVVGNARTQPAVLVEPQELSEDGPDPEQRRASVVGSVSRANEMLPGHAQIHSTYVRILDSPNSFLRSSKGEVQRAPTAVALDGEIEQTFKAGEDASCISGELDFSSTQALQSTITSLLATPSLAGRQLRDDESIYNNGFDSLKTMQLLRHIKKSSKASQHEQLATRMSAKIIYQNPTPASLSVAILRLKDGTAEESGQAVESVDHMESTLESFTARIEKLNKPNPSGLVIVLTGSTGSLGSYMLDNLLRNPEISEVICLNRPGSDEEKQRKSNAERGLSCEFTKATFLEVDVTKENLGMDQSIYSDFAKKVTHLVHNAWPVNFNLPFSSFTPQLDVIEGLLQFAHEAPRLQDFFFLSSVGVANDWPKISRELVPEAPMENLTASESMGYAQSKHLAELILQKGSEHLNVPVTVCRLGQIAGPVKSEKGMWPKTEWFPSLMLSCEALKMVPSNLGAMDCMDWIPVDLLAEAIVETMQSEDRDRKPNATRHLNFVNPHNMNFAEVSRSVAPRIDGGLDIVPYNEWVEALTKAAENDSQDLNLPAAKLLEFFHEIGKTDAARPRFSTERSRTLSPTLKDLPSVGVEWIQRWLQQWGVLNQKPVSFVSRTELVSGAIPDANKDSVTSQSFSGPAPVAVQ